MLLQILTTLLLIYGAEFSDQLPLVKTPLGEVRGYLKNSYEGRKFSAFEGIPYAKPPVGERRFEEPEPVEPWQGIWNASYLTECAQTVMAEPNKSTGVEDCLHINVFVPREDPNSGENLDVVVHIHGGAYMYGSGHSYSPPDIIMDIDVILVTFNYRLGIFGFLSTEDDVVPGNNGLKDQSMALKWVQENIASFGGNPNSVTLMGVSAGGSSCHLHYFSELSRGLFHRGYSESGLALNPFSIQEKPLIRTKQLADAVGCPTDSTRLLVDCMKQRPLQHILAQVPLFFTYLVLPTSPFGPVVEKGGSKPFLNEDPYISLKRGHQVYDVPWLTSTTTHEGLSAVAFLLDNLDYIDENWEQLAPDFLEFNNTLSPSLWASTARKIKEFYLGSENINKDSYMKLVQMFTDRIFGAPAETAVKMQPKVNTSPVYYYLFGYPGDNNPDKVVDHAADAIYFWGGEFTPNELKMKNLLLNMLTEFAKTGKPVFGEVDWKATQYDKLTYLSIAGVEPGETNLETAGSLFNTDFWNSLQFEEGENLVSKKIEL